MPNIHNGEAESSLQEAEPFKKYVLQQTQLLKFKRTHILAEQTTLSAGLLCDKKYRSELHKNHLFARTLLKSYICHCTCH